MKNFSPLCLAVLLSGAVASTAGAQVGVGTHASDWVEGTQALDDGATRDFYNRAAWLGWQHQLGDWTDADGVIQGAAAFAVVDMIDDDTDEYDPCLGFDFHHDNACSFSIVNGLNIKTES